MWSCYILDEMVSAGVDENLAWTFDVPGISLPSQETDFLRQTPGASGLLELDSGVVNAQSVNIGLRAHIVRVSYLRSQTLR